MRGPSKPKCFFWALIAPSEYRSGHPRVSAVLYGTEEQVKCYPEVVRGRRSYIQIRPYYIHWLTPTSKKGGPIFAKIVASGDTERVRKISEEMKAKQMSFYAEDVLEGHGNDCVGNYTHYVHCGVKIYFGPKSMLESAGMMNYHKVRTYISLTDAKTTAALSEREKSLRADFARVRAEYEEAKKKLDEAMDWAKRRHATAQPPEGWIDRDAPSEEWARNAGVVHGARCPQTPHSPAPCRVSSAVTCLRGVHSPWLLPPLPNSV